MKKLIFFFLFIPVLINAQITSEMFAIGNVPVIKYTPSNFDAAKKYPVWLYLHGDGQVMNDKADLNKLFSSGDHLLLLAAADKHQFIVIAPQLIKSLNDWNPGWTNKYLQPVYDYILNSPNTDLAHIVVTGISRGGGGTWVVCTGPFAPNVSAAIPICGTPNYDEDYSQIAKYNIPIWAFHAKDDRTIGYVATPNTIALINKYNPVPKPISTIWETGGHAIWGKVYSDQSVYTWALSQSNAITIAPLPVVPVKKILSVTYFADGSSVIIYDDKSIEFKQ